MPVEVERIVEKIIEVPVEVIKHIEVPIEIDRYGVERVNTDSLFYIKNLCFRGIRF